MSNIFRTRLKELRAEKQLTQDDMAPILHVSRSTYSGWESEGKRPDFDMICQIAKYFGVTCDYLLGYSDEKNHVERVFPGDSGGSFKKLYAGSPKEVRNFVNHTFADFYRILSPDLRLQNPDRIEIFGRLLASIANSRAEISRRIETLDMAADPLGLTEFMNMQSELKSTASMLFDELARADVEIAFKVSTAPDTLKQSAT